MILTPRNVNLNLSITSYLLVLSSRIKCRVKLIPQCNITLVDHILNVSIVLMKSGYTG